MRTIAILATLILAVSCQTVHQPNDRTQLLTTQTQVLDLAKNDPATTCEQHHVDLRLDYAPVEYGLPSDADRRFQETKAAHFPHADTPIPHGCIVGPWKTARVKLCYQCQSAYHIWERTEQLNKEE